MAKRGRERGRHYSTRAKINLILSKPRMLLLYFVLIVFIAGRNGIWAYFSDIDSLLNEFSINAMYVVSFAPNGGQGTMGNQSISFNLPTPLRENAYTKEGYLLNEWNLKADGTGTPYQDKQVVLNSDFPDVDNILLYAQWEPITYSVHFDANSGTGTMSDQTFTYDVQDSLTSNAFTRETYVFNGWNTEADGSGTSYTDGQQVLNLTTTNEDTITLYAQWEATDNSLTITNFNRNIAPIVINNYLIIQTGYKVLGITIQNNHNFEVNNWTVEFNSSENAQTNRPNSNNNALRPYLNSENYYGSVTNSNGKVIVTGTDTLAPGATKTVYVFFSYTSILGGGTTYNFTDEIAYYTSNSGRRNAPALKTMGKTPELKEFDLSIYDEVGIFIEYDTELISDNLYSTVMNVYIINNTDNDISNVKFDVLYNYLNKSKLVALSSIDILSNDEKGASFSCNDIIPSKDYKVYTVIDMLTNDGFDGMDISNITFENR